MSDSAANDLRIYLEAAGYSSIYVNFEPSSPDAIIVLFDYDGPPDTLAMGDGNRVRAFPLVQVKVRKSAAESQAAHSLAVALYGLVHGKSLTMNSQLYQLITANQRPGLVGRDAQQRPVYGFNLMSQRAA